MTIRAYAEADREAVLAVWAAAAAVGHPFLSAADLATQRLLVAEVYLPMAETWLAQDAAGEVEGFIGLLDRHVGGLFVLPDRHRRGVGARLLAHALAVKGPPLTLEVYEANPGAVAFYVRQGFAVVGRKEEDDQGRPLPLLMMRRDR